LKESDFVNSHRTDVRPGRLLIGAGLFALIATLVAADIAWDARAGTPPSHLVAEALVMVLALAGVAALWQEGRSARHDAERLRIDLEAAQEEARRFRNEAHDALRGLGEAIDRQFDRWLLTGAEREVGLLLLKGLSHKAVAEVRRTSETTIRQQALAVYRKAGLRGRSELSAFFLEDLLLPTSQR